MIIFRNRAPGFATEYALKCREAVQIYNCYDSEFQAAGALTLKASADNASAICGAESNDLSPIVTCLLAGCDAIRATP